MLRTTGSRSDSLFIMGMSLKGKLWERILSYKNSFLWHGKSLLSHKVTALETVTIFITHVCNCVMGATPMGWNNYLLLSESTLYANVLFMSC